MSSEVAALSGRILQVSVTPRKRVLGGFYHQIERTLRSVFMVYRVLYNTPKQKHHEDCHHSMRRFFMLLCTTGSSARQIPAGLILGLLFLTACLPPLTDSSTPTPPPSDTPLPSPTIVWFPPSATPTLKILPPPSATPQMNPGIGALRFSDDFSTPSEWDTAVSEQASAAISRNRLTLVAEPGVYLASMNRKETFGDFYAEITARPSLCRGESSYGIIVRASGSSFYRFTLNCNALISAERVRNNVRLVMQPPIPSADAPPGAPGEVRIGIWAVGTEMRLFLNGRFQFSISDPTSPTGALGVFVRGGDAPASVTFSELSVYDVNYIPPTKTPSP